MIKYAGTVGSSGLAIGEVYIYKPFVASVEKISISESKVEENLALFSQALKKAYSELELLGDRVSTQKPGKYEILDAHKVILEDEEVNESIERAITDEHKCAPWAVQSTYDKFINILKNIDDPLIRERVSDMQDVHNRIQRCLQNIPEMTLAGFDKPCIVVTDELLPSDAVSLDPEFILGILTERGGPTSHTAIIAKSHGIPAILGIKNACTVLSAGQEVVLDAINGVVLTDLDSGEMLNYKEKLTSYQRSKRGAQNYLLRDTYTRDGTRIEIKVNIGSVTPKDLETSSFSDGVGLFRSEFLYMESDSLPDEEVQFNAYKSVLEAFDGKPVVLRTLDIGGDKKLPYLDLPSEENPFLGKRALRLCLDRTDIFKTQLRAALRASVYGNLWIMFPMVSSLDDIEAAMEVVTEVRSELDREGVSYNAGTKYGIMIEIPAIAMISEYAAKIVDFASVGTNDLCQYLTASDRMNPDLKPYYQTYHPAMFRILNNAVQSFTNKDKSISICGESGGDPSFVIPLIGFGMRSFSMSSSCIAEMKQMISHLDIEIAEKAASDVLKMSNAQEIRQYLQQLTSSLLDN